MCQCARELLLAWQWGGYDGIRIMGMVASPHRGPSCTPRAWGWMDVAGFRSRQRWEHPFVGLSQLEAPWLALHLQLAWSHSTTLSDWGTRGLHPQGFIPLQCFPTMESPWSCLPLPLLPTGKHPPAAVPAGSELQGENLFPSLTLLWGSKALGLSCLQLMDGLDA